MAGDPLRDAFRTRLAFHVAAASIAWAIVDTLNTTDDPDAAASFLTLRFGVPREVPFTFGSPGSNMWKEEGEVYVDLLPGLGTGHDTTEQYALALRNAFRNDRFNTTLGREVRILTVAPMNGGATDGAWWCETLALDYRTYNLG